MAVFFVKDFIELFTILSFTMYDLFLSCHADYYLAFRWCLLKMLYQFREGASYGLFMHLADLTSDRRFAFFAAYLG